jgi:hypothetical protein
MDANCPMSVERGSEDQMPLQISIMVLTSQLIFTVADGVPQFDIQRGCKVDSASAVDPNAGLDATIKRCIQDEQQAKDELQKQWAGFVGSDRALCLSETIGEKADADATPPSYVDLLSCLQDQQQARKLPKD